MLALRGEIDVAALDDARTLLLRGIVCEPHPDGVIEIDCSELEFIDSSGLGMLVGVHKKTGVKLVLLDVPEQCRPVFRVTQLDQLFELRDT